MSAKLRRNCSGAFLVQRRGDDAWQLSRAAPHEMTVFLRHAEQGAALAFGVGPISSSASNGKTRKRL